MATENFKEAGEIFQNAIEIEDPAKRARYLENVCKEDPELRAEVKALLKSHDEAGSFLEVPDGPSITLDGASQIEGPGTKIGRYELLELIGEGGMGLVYLAEQKESVKRKVALKIVKLGMDTKEVVARFETERQTLALLEYPNIAHVFDAGTTETGRPYFVMEYVEGRSITKYCDEQTLSVEDRLELFKQVCEGVHHAHQKGIIHRDIKLSNILISVHGDKAIPKIIDFGIAKAITQPLTEKTSYTEHGQLLGTPEYMSPEQAEMAYQDIDTRSDIYSLGVLLYELLAGVPPFDAKKLCEGGIDHIQQVICEEEPRTPSARLTSLGDKAKAVAERRRTQIITLTRRLHRELEWIPMKAMRKDRTRRYRSASELADDIQNYINGVPLIAGPESTVYRARKFVRKHAGSVATVALMAIVIVLGLVASIVMGSRAEQARKQEMSARVQAEQAQIRTEERTEKYRRLFYVHSVAMANVKYRERNISSARKLLQECPADLRGWEWHRLNRVLDEALITFGRPNNPRIASIAISPDDALVASGNFDGTIILWDAKSGSRIMTLTAHGTSVGSIAFSPDGKRIVSGSMDNTIKMWDAANGEELIVLRGHQATVNSVLFSFDGKQIISGSSDKTVKIWDAESGEKLLDIQEDAGVASIAITSDGKRLITSKWGNDITEWDALTGEKLRTLLVYDQVISVVSYSPDGKRIAVGCEEGMVKILDAATGEGTIASIGHGRARNLVKAIVFSPDGKRLASASRDHTVKIWDAITGKELTTLVGHEWPVVDVAFSSDGERIVSVTYPGRIKIWDVDADRESTLLGGHENQVRDIVFSPDGKRLISASMDKTIKVWDIAEVKEISILSGHDSTVWGVAISPDGKHIVSGSNDKTVRIWDAVSGKLTRTIRGHDADVYCVAFSPDGKKIASGSFDKTVKLWEVSTGEELRTFSGNTYLVFSVAFSPDGKRIVSAGGLWQGMIKVWDASTGAEVLTLSELDSAVRSVQFTSDGEQIISGSGDGVIRIWNAVTGDKLMALVGHDGDVVDIAMSPDGRRILSAGRGLPKVWDAATGAELMTLPAEDGVFSIAFSPDGKTIASSGHRNITLWESGPRPADGISDKRGDSTQ